MNNRIRFERTAAGHARRVSDAHRVVGELLLELGVAPHLVGYDPLCDGIRIASEQDRTWAVQPAALNAAVETLCDASNGEHAIRDAIGVGFLRPDDLHARIFPFSKRPSNSEFVCTLAELVRDRMDGMQ